jgi:hypothetical protein
VKKTKTFLKKLNTKLILAGLYIISVSSFAGPREDAKYLIDRIVGTQIESSTFEEVVGLLNSGQDKEAALLLTRQKDFYNIQLRNHFLPRTNEARTSLVQLNDYAVTLIGMVRDNVPYNTVLSADLTYIGAPDLGLTPYAQNNNLHYSEMDEQKIDLSDPSLIVPSMQSNLPGSIYPASSTSGIITSRQSSRAFFSGGTNRAMTRFLMLNYLCRDMEALHDISRPLTRVRKDITRSAPFTKDCAGCHSGMDGLTGAFANYSYNEDDDIPVYTAGVVQAKYAINTGVFKYGYETTSDSWINFWRSGQNSALMWRANNSNGVIINQKFGYSSGNGAKSVGREIASSKAFSSCAVKQVFKKVCLKSTNNLDSSDLVQINIISNNFEANNYNYREIWADTAVYCMGRAL